METIYYLRVSTKDQSVESQKIALGITDATDPNHVFMDEGISGAIDALARPGFGACARYCRSGDVLRVTALDRLGRNAIDVQQTFAMLIGKGVTVNVLGLGVIDGAFGTLLVTILSGVAQMERHRIIERTEAGRETAKRHLLEHGKTHRGKSSLGRPVGIVGGWGEEVRHVDPAEVVKWRTENKASIAQTSDKFGVSRSTVKRYCAV